MSENAYRRISSLADLHGFQEFNHCTMIQPDEFLVAINMCSEKAGRVRSKEACYSKDSSIVVMAMKVF